MASIDPAASTSAAPFQWSTAGLLGERGSEGKPIALIILNTPLPEAALFTKLWDAGQSLSPLFSATGDLDPC